MKWNEMKENDLHYVILCMFVYIRVQWFHLILLLLLLWNRNAPENLLTPNGVYETYIFILWIFIHSGLISFFLFVLFTWFWIVFLLLFYPVFIYLIFFSLYLFFCKQTINIKTKLISIAIQWKQNDCNEIL